MKKPKSKFLPLPSQEFLKEILDYDPTSGLFTWRTRAWHTSRIVGDPAAKPKWVDVWHEEPFYNLIYIAEEHRLFRACRLAWRVMTGDDPELLEVDHKNRVKNDDRFDNLRLVTRSINGVNTKLSLRNTSGIRGVWRNPGTGKWCAKIKRGDYCRVLGQAFLTIEDAAAAYNKASSEFETIYNAGLDTTPPTAQPAPQ